MSKRALIEPNPNDKRYIRRNEDGEIAESVDLNRSLSQDDQHNSKKTSKPGQGDQGDGHPATANPPSNRIFQSPVVYSAGLFCKSVGSGPAAGTNSSEAAKKDLARSSAALSS
ncbi:hypothetical protein ACVWYF_000215 [Hymenobacter sp. UYAg731]